MATKRAIGGFIGAALVLGSVSANGAIENIPYYLAGLSFETVPEPGSLLLFGFGLAGLGMARRKKAGQA